LLHFVNYKDPLLIIQQSNVGLTEKNPHEIVYKEMLLILYKGKDLQNELSICDLSNTLIFKVLEALILNVKVKSVYLTLYLTLFFS